MKKLLFTSAIALSTLMFTSCYSRIGKLVIVSTRNMDSKTDYVLLQKDVRGKGKTKKPEALEVAIDKAVKQFPTGEFMKNVTIEVSGSGKKIRIVGDVWGTAPVSNTSSNSGENVNKSVSKSVKANVEFKSGDSVTFKNSFGKIIEGKIIGVNQNTAIVEQKDGTKTEVKYEKLTKIER